MSAMTMMCAMARNLIHLDVGDDLRSDEKHQLDHHLETCAECRSYRGDMSRAMNALLTLRDPDPVTVQSEPVGGVVLRRITEEIRVRRMRQSRYRKFNLQVVALSVCSLSLAVVTIVQTLSSMRDMSGGGTFVSSQPVLHSSPGWSVQQDQGESPFGVEPDRLPANPPMLYSTDFGQQSF